MSDDVIRKTSETAVLYFEGEGLGEKPYYL